MSFRISLCMNSGPRQGQSQATVVLSAPDADALVQAAANKLRLKKKDLPRVRLFVWGAGVELLRGKVLEGLSNGDLVAVSLGEPYSGPVRASALRRANTADPDTESSEKGANSRAALWTKHSPSLVVVEWPDATLMNGSLGRFSTLLEHPKLCALETRRVVSLEEQERLPSSSYKGHNLYADLINLFLELAPDASERELTFVRQWSKLGSPDVVISYVVGALPTLTHELCHARYALEPAYKVACDEAWASLTERLSKWMRDLGYHVSYPSQP